jgi:hypothetical protein
MPSAPAKNPGAASVSDGHGLWPGLITVEIENVRYYLSLTLPMHLRERTIPSRIRSLAFELLELAARPKGRSCFYALWGDADPDRRS